MLQIGLRAHDFGKLPPRQMADVLAEYHPDSIQLALAKALSVPALKGSSLESGPGSLSPGYARRIRGIFEARGISIAVLGCYINPIHPDPLEREKSLCLFEEHLRHARDFGCALVGTETGSINADCTFHPDTEKEKTFDEFCKSAERLIYYAEKCGAAVAIEPVAHHHTVSTIEKTVKLLERFPSPSLRIIWDPVNLLPLTGLPGSIGSAANQEAFFKECLDAFGDKIAAVHAKDFRMENGQKTGDLPAGTGEFDWPGFLKLLIERKPGIDMLLENTGPVLANSVISFIKETIRKNLI